MGFSRLFKGDKVELTALTADDIPTISRWYQDSVFMRLYDALPAYPRGEAKWRKKFEDRLNEDGTYIFGIRTLEDNALVGWLEIDGILWAHRVCWISIGIGDEAERGKGYGDESMRLALNFIFNELNLHRVQLTVFGYNARAIKLYERLGFVQEGRFREFLERDGVRYDMLLFGLLRDEWRQAQSS